MITKSKQGFTLIEILIVVAIVAILASVSLGFYGSYVTKANRTDGRSALTDTSARLQKCKAIYGSYDHANCDATIPDNSIKAFYDISDDREASTFTLTATAVGRQSSDDQCTAMTLTNTGIRDGEPAGTNECW